MAAKCKWTKGAFDTQTGKRIAKAWYSSAHGGKAHCTITPAGRREMRGRHTYKIECDSWNKAQHQGSRQFGDLTSMKRWGCNFLDKY